MSDMIRDDERGAVEEQLKALGYIDPGAGSSMWQLMLAGFLKAWTGLTSLFGGAKNEDD